MSIAVTSMPSQTRLANLGAIYIGLNAAFFTTLAAAGVAGPAENPRVLYLSLLMAICSAPLLCMERVNGRYVLLCALFAAYFFFYGASDLAALIWPQPATGTPAFLSLAEMAILLGAILALVGYRTALAVASARVQSAPAYDWPIRLVIIAGVAFWAIGTAAAWIWQVEIQVTAFAMNDEFSAVSTLLVIAGRLLQPLGTIMLAYAVVTTRSRLLVLLIVALMGLQVIVGFVGDSKETAMRGFIILIIAGFLLEGKLPKAWLGVLVVFAIVAFPIFQAYRAEVMHLRGMSRAAAAVDIVRNVKLALTANEKRKGNSSVVDAPPTFLQRSALKGNMELLIAKTGTVAPFQNGHTLSLFFTGFVPRYFWPDKPDLSTGQLLNREFHVSEDRNTYISATHLGELYWNYGWPGIVVGMFALGFLLGFINVRCDLSERRTLTRLLVLVTAIYATIVRFEGSIALEYVVLVRSLTIIWILHLLFARVPVEAKSGSTRSIATPEALRLHVPQLLR